MGEGGGWFGNFGDDDFVDLFDGHAWVDARMREEGGDMRSIVG